MKKKRTRKIWIAILILAILVAAGAAVACGYLKYQEEQAKKHRQEVLEAMQTMEFTGEIDAEEPEIPKGVRHDNDVDFEKLLAINDEIYAWIYVPETKIDYPVAQSKKDDSYYLHYNMNREPEFAGCIYTEKCNAKDFSDPNTIIYGHNMKNKSMFGGLHYFEDREFFDKNPYFYIYTPSEIRTYQIFAAYEYDDRNIMNSYDFEVEETFQYYIDSIYQVNSVKKNIREEIAVTNKDHIVTLSTCVGGKRSNRYLVQGVLTDVRRK